MGDLASVLKKRRKELGLTLAQIADIMDVAEATVQRWESGNIKSLRHGKIGKLAEVLQVSPSELMGWDLPEGQAPSNVIPMPKMRKVPLVGTIAYDQIPQKNIVKIAGRDGSFEERHLTDQQLAALKAILDQLPEADDL